MTKKPTIVMVDKIVLLTPKNTVYFTQLQFDDYLANDSTVFLDNEGLAFGENELHIYVCEHYEIPNTKKRKGS